MEERFTLKLLEEATVFLEAIDEKASNKLFYNIERAKTSNNPKIFKKLTSFIWEFRAQNKGLQYRLLAFWDKRSGQDTLVVCTHGFIKKTDKVAEKELERARYIMNEYLKQNE